MLERNSDSPAAPHGDLTRRVLFWMLLLSLVPLAVMTSQGYYCGRQAIVEKTQDHLLSILNSRSALVSTWFDQRFSELDVVSSSPSVARCCAHFADLSEAEIDHEVTAMLRSVLTRVNAYDEIAVLSDDGTAIADVSIDDKNTLKTIDPRFVALVKATDVFQADNPTLSNGSVVLEIGRRIKSGGSHAGVIIARLNLTRGLDPLLQSRAGMGKTGKVYLMWTHDLPTGVNPVFRAGLSRQTSLAMLTEPFAAEDPVALRKLPAEFLRNATDGLPEANLDYTDYRGKRVWARAADIQPFNMELVVEQDTSEALAWLNTLIWRVGVTGLVTVALLVAAAFWISRRLGAPLRVLAQVAQRVRNGATEERVGPLYGAEAEEVRMAFNQMLDELREKQRELVRTATLASIGELSSSVVHEMRNPLSSIKMNLQALKREVEHDAANAELAAIAEAQVRRLEHMLDDLLQYGRPIEPKPEAVTFAELVQSANAVVGEQARAKQVRIELHDELLRSKLLVDPEQMCRALTNLLVNALQAVPAGGTISIRAHKQALWDNVGMVDVADTGSGLSEEAQERVFTPFFTTKQGGTGLGLANVKKIVELHGGVVTATNREEGGAIFSMKLPLVDGTAA